MDHTNLFYGLRHVATVESIYFRSCTLCSYLVRDVGYALSFFRLSSIPQYIPISIAVGSVITGSIKET